MAKKNVTRAKSKKTAELDAIYEGVMTCQPALLPSLVDEVAAEIKDNEEMGVPWRITAVLAGKDGEFFKQVANDAEMAKTMASLIDGLTIFSKRLELMKKLADTVTCRLLVAGCNHEKFNDWVKEAA
jgi:hypothetical protein